jgi:hypothetical protein
MRATEFINEEINPDITNPKFKHSLEIDGLDYTATVEPDKFSPQGGLRLVIKCVDKATHAGTGKFNVHENSKGDQWLESSITWVNPNYRGQNIASNIYAYAKMLGNDIKPSSDRTPAGKDMWSAWERSGEAKHLMKEDEPIISNPREAAKAWIEKVYAKYPTTMQNNHVMVWGEGDSQQFAMFELVPSFSKRGAVEVKWFQAYPLRAGVGSRAMKELQALAREDGISLTLFPWDKGQVSQAKLTKFYKGQGFKPVAKGSKSMAWDHSINEDTNNSTTTLRDLYDGDFPDRDETFWDYVTLDEVDEPLTIQVMPKHKVMIMLLSQYRAEHIDEVTDMMDDEQKEIVQSYINSPDLSSKIIVVANGRIIDGNHRALAAAIKGVPIRYIDLADLDEIAEM